MRAMLLIAASAQLSTTRNLAASPDNAFRRGSRWHAPPGILPRRPASTILAGIDREAASAASGRINFGGSLNELPQGRARNLLRHVDRRQLSGAGCALDRRAPAAGDPADVLSDFVWQPPKRRCMSRGTLPCPAERRSACRTVVMVGTGYPAVGGGRVRIPCGDGSWNRSWTPGRCGGRAQGQAGAKAPATGCAASAPNLRNLLQEAAVPAMGAPWSADALGKRAIGLGGRDRLRRGVCLLRRERRVLPLWESTIGD